MNITCIILKLHNTNMNINNLTVATQHKVSFLPITYLEILNLNHEREDVNITLFMFPPTVIVRHK